VSEGGLSVGQELCDLVYERDGLIMVQWSGIERKLCSSLVKTTGWAGFYYCVCSKSEPPNAKSHSCLSQVIGEVKPGFNPLPVRCSTQFGPPSAVPVLNRD